ncbi:MAG: bifunctional phosphopantothenoylcysteine decarboxylase/phosphopantothenate--cysteine ligase CoaBC [Alphaproteobacteria bacterium]|nr:bifunctional phosphopantothenoylcysteine decarboxylase/phosphopantothenate--cysteine ligase CoaBC [Alphaproteobacteria bacterium]
MAHSVLLIIGGGIAAYKSLELIRLLKGRGIVVRAILTKAAEEFVTPLSVASLTGTKIHTQLFNLTDEIEMGHIELSRSTDLLVVVPATADLMAKMAQGLANDLASTTLLATDKKVLLAPAMNVRMWLHAATQRNVAQLKQDGIFFVGPNEGEMACGEFGPGRMAEPVEILGAIEKLLNTAPKVLAGKRVLITAGPTREAIDPVRYISNYSSGKQGYAIAEAARDAGADVTLVSGPVSLAEPESVKVVHVQSADDMLAACQGQYDVVICAAAVADWKVANATDHKIKKSADQPVPILAFAQNPDILAQLSQDGPKRAKVVVGFAAETDRVIDHAKAKLTKKGCDLIVANDVSPASGVFGGERNTVHLVSKTGVEDWPSLSKSDVATRLVAHIAAQLS